MQYMTNTNLGQDGAPISVSDDPVGVINDICGLATSLSDHVKVEHDLIDIHQVLSQITESCMLLSTSQLMIRHDLQPDKEKAVVDDRMEVNGGGKKRVSLGKLGPEGRASHVLGELIADLRGMFPIKGESAISGTKGVLVWLGGIAEKAFEMERD